MGVHSIVCSNLSEGEEWVESVVVVAVVVMPNRGQKALFIQTGTRVLCVFFLVLDKVVISLGSTQAQKPVTRIV